MIDGHSPDPNWFDHRDPDRLGSGSVSSLGYPDEQPVLCARLVLPDMASPTGFSNHFIYRASPPPGRPNATRYGLTARS